MSDEELLKAKMLPDHKIDYDKIYIEAEEYFEILKGLL